MSFRCLLLAHNNNKYNSAKWQYRFSINIGISYSYNIQWWNAGSPISNDLNVLLISLTAFLALSLHPLLYVTTIIYPGTSSRVS